MKKVAKTASFVLLLLSGWFGPEKVSAQSQLVFLRLKGLAVDGTPTGAASDLQVVGDLAYLAWDGLQIFSLSNPPAPMWVGGYSSGVAANAIEVLGQYAYLAEGAFQTLTNDPGTVEIIDVSKAANPVRVGGISTLGRAQDIRIAGKYAYVAESTRWTGTNLLGALEIFDVSTPTNPLRVAIFDTAGAATSVDISGDYAYVADGVTDLQVLNVSHPGNPQRVGVYGSDVLHNACGFEPGGPAKYVKVVGNLAYSAGENGLHVLDISDPSHPASIGDNFCFPIQSLFISGHLVYATVWSSYANTYILGVLNAMDPANLIGVGRKENWNSPVFQVVGNLVYLATNPLSVYEISDRPAITSLSVNNQSLLLTWDYAPGFVLQRAITMADPQWSDVPGSTNATAIELPLSSGSEFFRLTRP